MVLDRGIPGRAFTRARDELCTVVEGDDPRAEVRHPPRESSRAACDIQDGVSGTDLEETFSRWLDQQRLEVVAVADPVVPPAGVRIPYPAIVIALFRKLRVPGPGGHSVWRDYARNPLT